MSRAKLGYDFIAVPRRRHAGWVGLANGCGQFLFSPLFEINEGGPIPFHGADWRVWLCRVWCLAGKARSPICKALDELAERGVIAVGEGVLSVLFHPDASHPEEVSRHNSARYIPVPSACQPELGTQPPQLSPNAGRHLELSIGNDLTPKRQTDRQTRQTEEKTPTAADTLWRRPLGEPPPDCHDSFARSFAQTDLVWSAMQAAYERVADAAMSESARRGHQFKRNAPDILAAAERNAAARGELPAFTVESVLRVTFRAFYASTDDWLVKAGFPLKTLSERFAEFFKKGRFEWETDPDWSLKQVKQEQSTGNKSFSTDRSSLSSGGRR